MRGKQNKILLSLVCCSVLVSSTGFSQAAHADSDWFSVVVNPLLKEVVVPALKTSMNNWKAKRQEKKQQDSSMYELQVDAATEMDTTVEADASSETQVTASGWRLPEEPVH